MRHNKQQRQEFAALIPQRGVATVAAAAKVHPTTVKRWANEFGVPTGGHQPLVVPPQSPPNYSFTPHPEKKGRGQSGSLSEGDGEVVIPEQNGDSEEAENQSAANVIFSDEGGFLAVVDRGEDVSIDTQCYGDKVHLISTAAFPHQAEITFNVAEAEALIECIQRSIRHIQRNS